MVSLLALLVLAGPAVSVGLPAVCDLWLALRRRRQPPPARPAPEPLLFLVPAHDEELLVRRCVASLRAQDHPAHLLEVVVVADNCTDATASVARAAGATVLERRSADRRGKGYAIEWALSELPLERYAAVVIVDADTLVDPDYASRLCEHAPLAERALQSYDGMSNEDETWLTRLAGLLTRNRYGIALTLKERAGLNTPLTGDGTVLGTGLLRREGWRVVTITEGWELYARFTLAGIRTTYVPGARLYAQEARSMAQSGTQRARWTAGRFAVLRLYAGRILARPGLPLLQRLDLLAELSNPGPVMRAFAGGVGALLALAARPAGWPVLVALFASGIAQPLLYTVVSLARHPDPWPTVAALARFPAYAAWRVAVGLRTIALSGRGTWVRTARHEEGAPGR